MKKILGLAVLATVSACAKVETGAGGDPLSTATPK